MTTAVSESLETATRIRPWITPAGIVQHLIKMSERHRQAHALSKLDGHSLNDPGSTKEESMSFTQLSRLPAEVAPKFNLPDRRVDLRFIRRAFRDAQPLLAGCYDRHGG